VILSALKYFFRLVLKTDKCISAKRKVWVWGFIVAITELLQLLNSRQYSHSVVHQETLQFYSRP